MPAIIENLSQEPAVCVILTMVVFLFSYCTNCLLLGTLLKMHRSRSAVKKLKKQYTLRQRLLLCHFRDHCLHAVGFCRGLIVFLKIGWGCLSVYLFCALVFAFGGCSAHFLAWLTAGIFMVFDLPAVVIHSALARPLIGRFREYSFEKYHNTENHHSLL